MLLDLPDSAAFAASIADARFPAALAISLLAGLVRGFSGFGSALIYVPLMSAVYSPQIAAPTFVIADLITGLAFLSATWRKANWREIFPMAAAAVASAQPGTLVLQYADPIVLRWSLSIFVALVVVLLASGWRYRGRSTLALSVGIGLLAGLLGGAVQISGPPIILYWLGGLSAPDVLRANFFGYFSLFSAASTLTYALHGLLTPPVLALALFVTPVTIAGMAAGSYLFRFASEKTYRWTGYAVVALSALISAPLFDRVLR